MLLTFAEKEMEAMSFDVACQSERAEPIHKCCGAEMVCWRVAGTFSALRVTALTTLNSLMSRFSRASAKPLFLEMIGPENSKPYRCLLAGVAVRENGSVALKLPLLSVKKRAPW
jgi:hypothetical protein